MLRDWLCDRIGLSPTKDFQCIGSVNGGIILGVVGFDGYNGASIQMHAAGDPGWLTKELLWASFDYAFNVCKVNMTIVLIDSANAKSLRFNSHLGFKEAIRLEGAHPDGALVIMTMTRGECRYLNKDRHGQEILSTATA